MNLQAQRDISRKLKVFKHAAGQGTSHLPVGILGFQEKRITSGSELIRHMGSNWHLEDLGMRHSYTKSVRRD